MIKLFREWEVIKRCGEERRMKIAHHIGRVLAGVDVENWIPVGGCDGRGSKVRIDR